jgi:hypothetical protein
MSQLFRQDDHTRLLATAWTAQSSGRKDRDAALFDSFPGDDVVPRTKGSSQNVIPKRQSALAAALFDDLSEDDDDGDNVVSRTKRLPAATLFDDLSGDDDDVLPEANVHGLSTIPEDKMRAALSGSDGKAKRNVAPANPLTNVVPARRADSGGAAAPLIRPKAKKPPTLTESRQALSAIFGESVTTREISKLRPNLDRTVVAIAERKFQPRKIQITGLPGREPFYLWNLGDQHTSKLHDVVKMISQINGKTFRLLDAVCANATGSWVDLVEAVHTGAFASSPIGRAIAGNLVRVAATRINAEPEESLVELVVNSIDASSPLRKSVGKFGMGFYSVLAWLVGRPDRTLTIRSICLLENQRYGYVMQIFEDNGEFAITLNAFETNLPVGTTISLDSTTFQLEQPFETQPPLFDDACLERFVMQLRRLRYSSSANVIAILPTNHAPQMQNELTKIPIGLSTDNMLYSNTNILCSRS